MDKRIGAVAVQYRKQMAVECDIREEKPKLDNLCKSLIQSPEKHADRSTGRSCPGHRGTTEYRKYDLREGRAKVARSVARTKE